MIDVSNLVKTPIRLQGKPIENMYIYTDEKGTLVCKNCTKCGLLGMNSRFPSKGPNKKRSVCKDCYNLAVRKVYQNGRIKSVSKRHITFWEDTSIPIKCYICSGPYEEIEHVWSTGLGGPDTLTNTLPSCVQCNRGTHGKRDRPLCEWLRNERPEYLEIVISKVLSYGVDPFTPCEKVTINSEDIISSRWVFCEPMGNRQYVDITDDIMEESYRDQRTAYEHG